MGGGLLQLVAYGAQDVYLTGNPQITFFKVVYRRHTNFSIESIIQSHNGTVGFGSRMTCQISRNGDLLHKLYLQVEISGTTGKVIKTQNLGHYIIKTAEVEIGGQLIDRQYGIWMQIWNELTLPSGKKDGFNKMIGNYNHTNSHHTIVDNVNSKLYIPLEFWFCRNVGLALPLIALQYHEVKININFNDLTKSYASTADAAAEDSDLKLSSAALWADYIFLDTDERRRFAQLSHEYLIEQVQFTGSESADAGSKTRLKMSFNHPVKELVWVNMDDTEQNKKDWCVWQQQTTDKVELQLNGNDRFAPRDPKYFTLVQPYQHHTNIPVAKNIGVYSFALKPEEHQPSGTLNMSRIDTAQITIPQSAAAGNIYLFAHSYNVLRILSGMGGLAYSN
jgi:hypothetical protein